MSTEFEKMFAERSPEFAFVMYRFREALEKDCVDFSDVNTANLRKLRNYLEMSTKPNTMRTYFAILGAYLRECHNDGLIDNVKCLSALRVKKTPQQNVALTEDEVQKLYDYYESILKDDSKGGHQKRKASQAERDVLTLFLIECYCGARSSDVERFTADNIKDGNLSYVSKKTKTYATMPAHIHLNELIARIPKRSYTKSVKNRIIKRVCKYCKIDEDVTIMYRGEFKTRPKYEYCGTHTARRSYVSNLLDRGVPITLVSKLAGHNNVIMTQRYYCSDKLNFDDNTMAFFNGQ